MIAGIKKLRAVTGIGWTEITSPEKGQPKPSNPKGLAPEETDLSPNRREDEKQETVIQQGIEKKQGRKVGCQQITESQECYVGEDIRSSGHVKALHVAALQEIIAKMDAIQLIGIKTPVIL